ncbi:F-box/FBD/LRR-repeat protein At1g13570-like [Bidens hawaiensis]|uniref:F-box/FBD/LRR-repeat protein At1g13570-like n=1 Tax=Bidens hawaiensis TaxID=980011 RepID=UPI0040499F61
MKAKRLSKAQGLDIISALPQAIIEFILCLLPVEEAARTSILSRDWRYKWTTIPKLEFVQSEDKQVFDSSETFDDLCIARRNMDLRCKLFYDIHQVLLLRHGPIHEFALTMDAPHTCFEIDQIILHLLRNHTVKKLTLDFYEGSFYGLPLSFFSLHHLTDLCLENCDINHKPIFNGFGSLTNLSLTHVTISKEALLHLLSNCPSLKTLCLQISEEDFQDRTYPSITELFKCLPVIEDLTTWGYIIPPLVDSSLPQELPPSLIRLKTFCIDEFCFVDGYGLPFLAVLIKCSPNLEKLKIIGYHVYHDDIEPDNMEEYSNVWLERLNELEIDNLNNYEPELEFVKFILTRSRNLKKVTLVKNYMLKENQKLDMLKVLLNAPRASPTVEIVVS